MGMCQSDDAVAHPAELALSALEDLKDRLTPRPAGGAVHGRSLSMHQNMMGFHKTEQVEADYEPGLVIGIGATGRIARATHRRTGAKVALKTIRTDRVTVVALLDFVNEVKIMASLDHPNIAKPMDFYSKPREVCLVLPLYDGGNLYERQPYAEAEARRYLAQLFGAVAYMHALEVIHRDLKFENILFISKEDPESEVVIIDFGTATILKGGRAPHPTVRPNEAVGTLYTMAPEVLQGRDAVDHKCDVWSLGVIAYMLLASKMPFVDLDDRTPVDEAALLRLMERGAYDGEAEVFREKSVEARAFVAALLVPDRAARPTTKAASLLPWIASTDGSGSGGGGGGKRRIMREESIADHLLKYAQASKLRRLTLMLVAYRRTSMDMIKEYRSAFRALDTDQDGSISYDELHCLLRRCGQDDEGIRAIFDAVDVERDQTITFTEFSAALLEGSAYVQEEDLADAFRRLAEGSDAITRSKLRDVLGTTCCSARLADEIIARRTWR